MVLEPIVQTIEVPCSQEKAFKVFVDDMNTWWPVHQFSVSALRGEVAFGVRVDPKLGGTIVELGPDGSEHLWGTFTSFDPYDVFKMDFHIGEPAASASHVEVRFSALADNRTRVELTQSNWEAFGKKARMMFGGYAKGWAVIFEQAYRAACGG